MPIVGGAATASTTVRLPSHRALESLADLSAARRYQVHYDPTSLTKYNGETKPELWLANFWLACQLCGARDNKAIIHQLPLFLSDTGRRWLEELPPDQIRDWTDLVRVFEGNFKGTYIRPGNSWDL